jgi:hypothetical protein
MRLVSLAEERADLAPEQAWTREFRDTAENVLLRQTEGEYDRTPAAEIQTGPQPRHAVPDPAHRTADDWVQLGMGHELQGELLVAIETYQACGDFRTASR